MADEILYGLSTNELKKEIDKYVLEDQRALPHRSKVFAAVARIQKFDVLPEIVEVAELDEKLKDPKCIELNRGIAPTKGVPAQFYAKELVLGPMYPGTLTALGNGMYFATPSHVDETNLPTFPRISVVALKYAKCETVGVVIRAALKPDSKIVDCEDLKADLRTHRNRVKLSGITDVGTFAASLGFDAYYADGVYEDCDERVYTVLNRGSLLVQSRAKLVGKPIA